MPVMTMRDCPRCGRTIMGDDVCSHGARRSCSICGESYPAGSYGSHTRGKAHRLHVAKFRMGGHNVGFAGHRGGAE